MHGLDEQALGTGGSPNMDVPENTQCNKGSEYSDITACYCWHIGY